MRTCILGLIAAIALGGCHKGSDDTDGLGGTDTDDTDQAPDDGYPSTFASGRYRLTEFVLMPLDTGGDVDGDGTQDNRLPNLLTAADLAVSGQQLSPDEVNANIAAQIAAGDLAVLLDAVYAELDLTVDVFGGTMDVDSGAIAIDPSSYDDQGNPRSELLGQFSSETEFAAGPADVNVPVIFVPEDPPVLVPLVHTSLTGTMDADGVSGMMSGIIPANDMIDQVIDPIIPEEGYDTNGDGTIDMTKADIMELVTTLVNNENMSDIVFDDGSRGISAAFTVTAVPATFEP
jgi:hypothetical protein